VPREAVRFPATPVFPFASYMPQVWRMDFGPEYSANRVITKEPPLLGAPYRVLVPQVNADGNDLGGVPLQEIAVPLGTYTGWNIRLPQLASLGYLGGLIGGFEPFAATRTDREASGDARLSIAERYKGSPDYLERVRQAAAELVRQRFMLAGDVPAVVRRAEQMWMAVAGS
jgi:hypothetical protein